MRVVENNTTPGFEQVAYLVPPALLLKGADRKHPLRKRALTSAILAIPPFDR